MKFRIPTLIAAGLLATSCAKDQDDLAINNNAINLSDEISKLIVPKSFAFNTAREIEASVHVLSLKDQPLAGTRVSFYTDRPDQGGHIIASGITDAGGQLDMPIRVPAYQENVFVQVHSMGFNNQALVSSQENINLSFGGVPETRNQNFGKMAASIKPIAISGNFYYMGAYSNGNKKGLPAYLEANPDVISQGLLDDITATLPEGTSIPNSNPNLLATGNQLDVVLTDQSDVWVTFLAEGAQYQNALGYYVFDSSNPPASAADIDSIFVILPNASLDGSNGQLQAGDKVKLGTFAGGKTISWVLFQDAWTGNGVNVNATKFFSRFDFNTMESNVNKRQHSVQFVDYARELLINGFEDQTRSTGSDNDFNDLTFYATANPWTNVDVTGVPPITPATDCDNDGVSDDSDDFPCDASRAIRNTYLGTLAYEDLWPSQGDYDFNDMVIDYDVDHILNSNNKLVSIEADWTVKAVGAGFKNGFGFEFTGLASNSISAISGQDLQDAIVSVSGNGTEQGQTNATVIAFDNVFNVMPNQGTKFINTIKNESAVAPVTVSNVIDFSSPQVQGNVGLPPYNAFIFANGNRGREIHLADKTPTDLADLSLFATQADATDAANEYYYKTANGLPWAINISASFAYPTEYSPVDNAYNFFATWAVSGGTLNSNWFTDEAGNRNTQFIY
jgi:LruC domain-containing protein